MNEKSRTQLHLEELGVKADIKTVREISNEIFSSWNFKGEFPEKPVALYLGGFQGSGKTTALDLLAKDMDFALISPDEIRHKLFERDWRVSEKFVHTVNATRNDLLRRALYLGHHIAIDQLTTEERVKLMRKTVEEVNPKFKTVTVFLEIPHPILEERVRTRKGHPGNYNGTVEELRQSLRLHGHQTFGIYDRVIHADKMTPIQIVNELRNFFK